MNSLPEYTLHTLKVLGVAEILTIVVPISVVLVLNISGANVAHGKNRHLWQLWFSAKKGGRSLSGGRPAQAGTPKLSPAGPPGGHRADPLRPGEIGCKKGLGCSQVVSVAPLHRLYFL